MTAGPSAPGRPAGDRRDETEAQREDRNLAELLQELRVAGLGVQVLFGFLLALPFTTRFAKLSDLQRVDYLVTLLLAVLSTILLVGPVSFHRLVFHRHEKGKLLATANVMALAGLMTVALAISSAVLLVTSFVDHGVTGPVIAGCTAAAFAGVWFVLPIVRRVRDAPH